MFFTRRKSGPILLLTGSTYSKAPLRELEERRIGISPVAVCRLVISCAT